MYKARIIIFSTLLLLAPTGASGEMDPEPQESLCRADEIAVFECEAEETLIAICTGRTSPSRMTTQYRYGRLGAIEFSYPDPSRNHENNMYFWMKGYSGGGESRIEFWNAGYLYAVYDRITRTSFGHDGRHDPQVESGVSIMRAGDEIRDRRCTRLITQMNEDLADRILRQ